MKTLTKYIPIPIIIGLFAAIMIKNMYGIEELIKQALAWTMGSTIITTMILTTSKYNEEDENGR